MDWIGWIGKEIFVRLKSGKVYSGKVNFVDDADSNIIWFDITDKFGDDVSFPSTEIIEIKEEKHR